MANFKVGDRVRIKNPNKQIGQDDGTYEVTLIRPDGMVSIKAPSEKVGFAVRPEQLIANARARSTNSIVAKALNAVARNASGLDGLIADLDSRKYDSINWMPKVIGPGTLYPDGMKFPTGLGYDDEEKVRAAWKSGKYASVVLYKGGSKRGEIPVNAATSTVRAKACNAAARNANFRGSAWDRALAVSVRPKFSKGNRVKVVGHPMEDGVRGIVEKTFPSGQVLITTGYDKDGHPYTVQVHQSYLVRNSVVQKALNVASDDPDALEAAKALQTAIRSAESAIGSAKKAKNPGAKRNVKMIADALENLRIAFYGVRVANAAACNAKFRVFLDNGRETEIVATSESSASDKVLQKFKFWGDKAPKVSRVVRLKPVVSGRFVGKANGLEYYVDYTDDLGFAKKYGKDGTNVTEIHINTPYLKDEDGRERRHIVYTWSRGSEWIGDKFKHPDFPDAARAARDLAAKLIRSNPNVAKIGDDTNDWR